MSDGRIVPGERIPSLLVQVGGHPCAITRHGAYGSIPLKLDVLRRLRFTFGEGVAFTAMDADYARFDALLTISSADLPEAYDEPVRRDMIVAAIRGACELDKLLKQCGGFENAARYIASKCTKKA